LDENAANRVRREAVRSPWLGVELRHLAALAAVARERSFRGAAESLGYVQSAVSQQVAYLERIVGQRLVERERGVSTVVLTPAGALLLDHADRILAGLGAAYADLEDLAQGQTGRLRLGACHSLAAGVLPRVLPHLLRRAPRLRLDVTEGPATRLAAQVAEGSLDAAFAELPLPEGPFSSIEVCTDPYLLLAHPERLPTRGDSARDVPDLSTLQLIGHPHMVNIEPFLRAAGVGPRYAVRCDSLVALQTLIAAGVGCAIVPALLGVRPDGDIVALPFDHVIPPRPVCVFRHSGRMGSPSVELLVELATWLCGSAQTPIVTRDRSTGTSSTPSRP
jgi:DNA-binding transcriptional LysR family regulator